MAGGSDWRFKSKHDEGDLFQKVEGGPWFLRDCVVYTITKKILGAFADIGVGEYGSKSGMITFSIGGVVKTRSISNGVFVCKYDGLEDLGEAQKYVGRVQTWVFESRTENEIDLSA